MNRKWIVIGFLACPFLVLLHFNPATQFFLAPLTPISFYGKVVDEKDGTPIAGATAEIDVADKLFKDGSVYKQLTDKTGQFSITGTHGLGLGITVSKEGYYHVPKSYGNYGYAPGVSGSPKPTSDQPAIFMLRKKGAGVQLIVKGMNGRLPPDGTPVEIDLETGKVVPPNMGNFRMEVWSNFNAEDPNTAYDWKYQISVPGGGFTARTNDLDFMAPSDGYQASEENSYTADQRPYIGDINKQYFVHLKDGRYARITLMLGNTFNILAYINPTPGDPNLEPASK
jgi:hypothetical protein